MDSEEPCWGEVTIAPPSLVWTPDATATMAMGACGLVEGPPTFEVPLARFVGVDDDADEQERHQLRVLPGEGDDGTLFGFENAFDRIRFENTLRLTSMAARPATDRIEEGWLIVKAKWLKLEKADCEGGLRAYSLLDAEVLLVVNHMVRLGGLRFADGKGGPAGRELRAPKPKVFDINDKPKEKTVAAPKDEGGGRQASLHRQGDALLDRGLLRREPVRIGCVCVMTYVFCKDFERFERR
jgi:hypothetical protein